MPSLLNRKPGNHGPGSIGCTRTLRRLESYLDSELDEITAEKITRHLEACDRCGLKAEAYRVVKQSLEKRRVHGAEDDPMVARLHSFADELMVTREIR